MKYTDILWDFNGTIFDDISAGIEAVNKLLRARNLPTLDSEEEYRSVFGFPIIDYYRKIGFDLEKESYKDVIAPEWVAEYLVRSESCTMRDGVKNAFELFRSNGLRQAVISATETNMLISQLKCLGIYEYFSDVRGLDNIQASSKVNVAKKWREENLLSRALFIGDTTHDAEVAEAIGADCVLIAGGHQSVETLRQCKCAVLNDFCELIVFLDLKR